MANFEEQGTDSWTGVYRIEEEDLVLAGDADNPTNRPLRQLVQRTRYLRNRLVDMDIHAANSAGVGAYVEIEKPASASTSADYEVHVTPTKDATHLGAVWVVRNNLFFRVYNSGGAGIGLQITVIHWPNEE